MATTTQTTQLPQWYQDYMATAAERGLNLANLPFTAYDPTQRIAALNPTQNAGINMIQQRAAAGSPLMGGMQGLLQNTMSGNYLSSNPYLQNINQTASGNYLNSNPYLQHINKTASGEYLQGNPYLDSMINKTQGDVQARMGQLGVGSGSFGNSGVMATAARELADSSNQMRYQNYDAERQRQMQAQQMGSGIYDQERMRQMQAQQMGSGIYDQERMRQMQAAGMAPAAAQSDYYDAQQMLGAGALQYGQEQAVRDANYQEFAQGREWPFKTQQAFIGSLGMNPGSTTTQQSPDPSKWATGLGAATTALWGANQIPSLWDWWKS